MSQPNHSKAPESEYSEKVVSIRRVSKKTKGGNQMSFTALVVVGDKKGKVGVALGKASDVVSAIKKGVRIAKKKFIKVPIVKHTLPFSITHKQKAAKVLLKPAPQGSGIIAGGAIRAVVEAAGISDVVGKILGSNNQINNVYATYEALKEVSQIHQIKKINHPAKSKDKSTKKKS